MNRGKAEIDIIQLQLWNLLEVGLADNKSLVGMACTRISVALVNPAAWGGTQVTVKIKPSKYSICIVTTHINNHRMLS